MTTKEYLEQYREDVPEWLKVHQRGESRPLADFLGSRIVYYPGAGIDGDPVEVFGASHSTHCFVYADYWLSKDELSKELHAHGFRGYDIFDEVSFSEREVMDAIPWRRHFLTDEEMRVAANGTAEMRKVNHPSPYALLAILERKPNFGDDHGPERLAILFLGADGIATYEAIFANGNAPRFFGFLLQDHGWGGNYDRFGRGGLLEKIMTRSKVFPHFVLTAHDRLYDGYAKVEWAESAGSRGRCLFYNVDMGCQPPKDKEEDRPKMSASEFFDIHLNHTYPIEFSKKVPIVEEEATKWLVDTGCPFSYPDPRVSIGENMSSFLGVPGLRMMGLDSLRTYDYVLIDYRKKTIVCSTDPIPFEGESVPLRPGMNDCLLVDMMIGGQAKSCYIDTGAAYSYLCGLDKNRFEPVGIADECDLRDQRWTAPVFRVPCEFAGHSFGIVCGAASDNKAGVPPDGVIGYDFFNSFTVLLNLREMRLTFKPAGK